MNTKLNPASLEDYIGQEQIKKNLKVILSAKYTGSLNDPAVDHMLFSGPAGLGKTSLAEIIADELRRPMLKFMGPHLKEPADLAVLETTKPWTFLFIDEIHALPLKVEEALYELIDDHKFRGKSVNSFTLVGATTKEGYVSKPLRSRFSIVERLAPYSVDDLCQIIKRSATILKLNVDDKATKMIAVRSRGTPRVANQLLKRISYYSSLIDSNIAQDALDNVGIDEYGLEMLDRIILRTMRDNFAGGPVGVGSLSNVMNEDMATIESREPYLVQTGFIKRTSKGRILTEEGATYVRKGDG